MYSYLLLISESVIYANKSQKIFVSHQNRNLIINIFQKLRIVKLIFTVISTQSMCYIITCQPRKAALSINQQLIHLIHLYRMKVSLAVVDCPHSNVLNNVLICILRNIYGFSWGTNFALSFTSCVNHVVINIVQH